MSRTLRLLVPQQLTSVYVAFYAVPDDLVAVWIVRRQSHRSIWDEPNAKRGPDGKRRTDPLHILLLLSCLRWWVATGSAAAILDRIDCGRHEQRTEQQKQTDERDLQQKQTP